MRPRRSRLRYGGRFPTTAAGRDVAVVLMISGIALFGVSTATIAAYFVEQSQHEQAKENLVGRLEVFTSRIERLEARLGPSPD
jgi:voltage-gated potassium channel